MTEKKSCADCGVSLPEGSGHTECRHCRKCIDFACMWGHDGKRKTEAEAS